MLPKLNPSILTILSQLILQLNTIK